MKTCARLLPFLLLLLVLFWGLQGSHESSFMSQGAQRKLSEGPLGPIAKVADILARGGGDTRAVEEQLRQRREQMRAMILANPTEALRQAISWREWLLLPAGYRAFTEEPFSMAADWKVLPGCAAGSREVCTIQSGERVWEVTPHGRWTGIPSKNAMPLTGIRLEGVAALQDRVLVPVSENDLATVQDHFQAPESQRRLPSGFYLLGGKLLSCASEQDVAELENRLLEADRQPGPESGSPYFLAAQGGDNGGPLVPQNIILPRSTWTETPKNILLLMVRFSDTAGDPVDRAVLTANCNTVVKPQIEGMSYNKTTVNFTLSPLLALPKATSAYLPNLTSLLLSDSKAAATAQGVSQSGFDIIGVVFPNINMVSGASGVSFAGLATVGGGDLWLQGVSGADTITHELGHNYGLNHAGLWVTVDGTVVGTGAGNGSLEYGDDFDLMGGGEIPNGHFGMEAKRRLNWIPAVDAPQITASGTYRLKPVDQPSVSSGLRGLKIAKSTGEFYWVGHRSAYPNNPSITRGAVLLWERQSFARSWLLDTTPSATSNPQDAGLVLGKTYSDTAAAVHITPIHVGGSAATAFLDVVVNLGAFPGNTAPTVSVGGPSTANTRQAYIFSANGSDANGDALSYFWDFGDGQPAPDATVVSKTWGRAGNYVVRVTASDRKGLTASATMNVAVTDAATQWVQRTSASTASSASLNDIASDATTCVVVGASGAQVQTSADGASWTLRSVPTSTNVNFHGITWTGSLFIAVGMDYNFSASAWQGVIYTSPTGTTWTRRYFGTHPLQSIASTGTVHVAVGEKGTVLRSTDGITFTPVSAGVPVSQILQGITRTNTHFIAVSHNSSPTSFNGEARLWRSSDGLSWTENNLTGMLDTWRDFRDVGFLNGRLYASGFYGGLRSSTDEGLTWQQHDFESYDLSATGFASGNGVHLAIGVQDNSSTDVDFLSIDGIAWTANNRTAVADQNEAHFFNGKFLTVGDSNTIFQSGPVTAPLGYTPWRSSYATLSGNNTLPETDADADGFGNALEYLCGTNPTSQTSRPSLVASQTGGIPTLTLNFPAKPTDVLISAETSTDLVNWTSAHAVVITNTNTQFSARLSATPAAGAPRRFLRIQADVGAE